MYTPYIVVNALVVFFFFLLHRFDQFFVACAGVSQLIIIFYGLLSSEPCERNKSLEFWQKKKKSPVLREYTYVYFIHGPWDLEWNGFFFFLFFS